jgi:GntR family transcriptional regulator/MocR family aminotransferase
VIEDDYDAEYRYDRDPVGALQGLAPDRVAYAGCASKVLAPGLRLGWLVLPPALVRPVRLEKTFDDLGTPLLDQLALADFLERGELDRHLRRMRPRYRARRDALVAALGRELPAWRLVGVAAGVSSVVLLPPEIDEQALLELAAARGMRLHGLSSYAATHRPPQPRQIDAEGALPPAPGLVLGFGNLSEPAIGRAVARMAEIEEELHAASRNRPSQRRSRDHA